MATRVVAPATGRRGLIGWSERSKESFVEGMTTMRLEGGVGDTTRREA